MPKPAAGMLSSPIIPVRGSSPAPGHLLSHTESLHETGPVLQAQKQATAGFGYFYDTHRTSVEITLSLCPLSVSTHSEEYFSSSKEHLLPQQSLQHPPRLCLLQWTQTVWVSTLRSSVDQKKKCDRQRMN